MPISSAADTASVVCDSACVLVVFDDVLVESVTIGKTDASEAEWLAVSFIAPGAVSTACELDGGVCKDGVSESTTATFWRSSSRAAALDETDAALLAIGRVSLATSEEAERDVEELMGGEAKGDA